jgi:hypothetical protein
MKRGIRSLTIVAVAALVAGCGTTALMNGIIASWMGSPISDVVQSWGLPNQEVSIGGRKYYVWNYTKSGFIPQTSTTTGVMTNSGVLTGQTTTSGGFAISGNCDRLLEVDVNDIVVGGSWRGNNCPFMEAFEYKTWRNPRVAVK